MLWWSGSSQNQEGEVHLTYGEAAMVRVAVWVSERVAVWVSERVAVRVARARVAAARNTQGLPSYSSHRGGGVLLATQRRAAL